MKEITKNEFKKVYGQNLIKKYNEDHAPLPKKITIRDLLANRCSQYADKIFLLDPVGKKEYSFLSFWVKVNAVSNLLWKLGVRKDDKVSLLMTNSPKFLWSYFGIMQLGAVACPVNIHLKDEEIAFVLKNSDSVALFVSEEYWETALRIQSEMEENFTLLAWHETAVPAGDSHRPVVHVNKLLAEEDGVLCTEITDIPIFPQDVAQIIYTSGTTGRPKGAMLTHNNLIIDAHWISCRFHLQEHDRAMCVMPLFHVNGQIVTVLTPLYHGGSIVLPERFSVSNFFPYIISYEVTYTGTVATMLSMLLNKVDPAKLNPESSLRIVFCGSAPVPVEVQTTFERTFKVPVIEGYGMTETTCRSTFNLLPPLSSLNLGESDKYRKLGSVGLPLGNEMMVVDDQGRPLGAKQVGEIIIHGENVMKGYYKNPQATAEALQNGWFHSGDLGYYDEDGYFFVVDRKTDMIIRGGENIYPREIEEVLYSHPAVKDAACTWIPNTIYGEEVVAFVELKDNALAGETEIITFCNERLAPFKCPKHVKIVTQIPKSPSGKLLRRKLREAWQD